MAQAAGTDERLPWIESPRRPAPPARRSGNRRGALLLLLALMLGGTIAVLAFLAGRSSAPRIGPRPTPAAPTAIQRVTKPVGAPVAPVRSPPVEPAPAPPPAPVQAAPPPPRASVARTTPRAETHRPPRKPAARRSPARHVTPAAPPRPIVAKAAPTRPLPTPSFVVPRLTSPWPRRPFAGPPGRVIQLGAYVTLAQADAAWWRLARAYPYLMTLPRMVTWVGPSPGRPRYYRVRLAAASRREARALCNHLHRIGRGCMVIRSAK